MILIIHKEFLLFSITLLFLTGTFFVLKFLCVSNYNYNYNYYLYVSTCLSPKQQRGGDEWGVDIDITPMHSKWYNTTQRFNIDCIYSNLLEIYMYIKFSSQFAPWNIHLNLFLDNWKGIKLLTLHLTKDRLQGWFIKCYEGSSSIVVRVKKIIKSMIWKDGKYQRHFFKIILLENSISQSSLDFSLVFFFQQNTALGINIERNRSEMASSFFKKHLHVN